MKELIRQYAGTAIAEKGIPKSRALCETDTAAFEGYWRSR